jgi:hypothetical protein
MTLKAGNISFDTVGRDVKVEAASLILPRRESAILEHSMRRLGRVVPKPVFEEAIRSGRRAWVKRDSHPRARSSKGRRNSQALLRGVLRQGEGTEQKPALAGAIWQVRDNLSFAGHFGAGSSTAIR